MNITFTTSGMLRQYLPSGSAGSSADLEIADNTTALEVMNSLGFPEDRTYLVILNGTLVPKAERATKQLSEGDELMVMPPLKGG